MLYLNPPCLVLEPDGVCVYPDHADPLTWYYLPMRPSISRDAQGRPLLSLTKYTSASEDFSILNFDANLGLAPQSLPGYRARLKALLQLTQEPRLLPMVAKEGSVELLLLGRKAAGDHLVRAIGQAASPALYSDNRAVFSVLLDKQGSDLVEASLASGAGLSALGVMYSLNFEALQPAYKVKARASWKTIHESLRKSFKLDAIFSGADISKVIDSLQEQRVIDIEVDKLQSDEQKTFAVQAMMAQVRTLVFEQFFRPAPAPQQSRQPSFLDGLNDLMKTGGRAVVTSGLSLLGSFTWTEEARKETEDKTLAIDLSERSVVSLRLCPQAFLSELAPTDGSTLVHEVDGAGSDFFTKRSLTIDLNQGLEGDGIASVVVDLDYGGKTQSLVLRKGSESKPATCLWTSARSSDGRLLRDVKLVYTVNFAARSNGSGPSMLKSPVHIVSGDYFTVAPRSLYRMEAVRFMTRPDFDWKQYPVVTLDCCYEDPDNQIHLTHTSALTRPAADKPTVATWEFLCTDPSRRQYQYRLAYQSQGGKTVSLGWRASELPLLILDPGRLDLQIYPPKPADWPQGVDSIVVDLAYADPANQIDLRVPVRFEAGQGEPRPLRLLVADADRRTIDYTVTCQGARTTSSPRSRTRQPSIDLSRPQLGRTFAVLRPAPSLFEGGQVTKVVAKLRHVENGKETQSAQAVFRAAGDSFTFEYDFESDPAYRCKLVFDLADAPTLTTREIEISDLDHYLVHLPQG